MARPENLDVLKRPDEYFLHHYADKPFEYNGYPYESLQQAIDMERMVRGGEAAIENDLPLTRAKRIAEGLAVTGVLREEDKYVLGLSEQA